MLCWILSCTVIAQFYATVATSGLRLIKIFVSTAVTNENVHCTSLCNPYNVPPLISLLLASYCSQDQNKTETFISTNENKIAFVCLIIVSQVLLRGE